jgi:hypothetical protein
MSGMGLSHENMKERIFNYLEYMSERDIREISTAIYNLARRKADKRLREEEQKDG